MPLSRTQTKRMGAELNRTRISVNGAMNDLIAIHQRKQMPLLRVNQNTIGTNGYPGMKQKPVAATENCLNLTAAVPNSWLPSDNLPAQSAVTECNSRATLRHNHVMSCGDSCSVRCTPRNWLGAAVKGSQQTEMTRIEVTSSG